MNTFGRKALRIKTENEYLAKVLETELQKLYPEEKTCRFIDEVSLYVNRVSKNRCKRDILNIVSQHNGGRMFRFSDVRVKSTTVIITNIPHDLDEAKICDITEKVGAVLQKFKYVRARDGTCLRFGWVAFEDLWSAELCAGELDQTFLQEQSTCMLQAALLPEKIKEENALLEAQTLQIEGLPPTYNTEDKIKKILGVIFLDWDESAVKFIRIKSSDANYSALIDFDTAERALEGFLKLDKFTVAFQSGESINLTASFALPGVLADKSLRITASAMPAMTNQPVIKTNISCQRHPLAQQATTVRPVSSITTPILQVGTARPPPPLIIPNRVNQRSPPPSYNESQTIHMLNVVQTNVPLVMPPPPQMHQGMLPPPMLVPAPPQPPRIAFMRPPPPQPHFVSPEVFHQMHAMQIEQQRQEMERHCRDVLTRRQQTIRNQIQHQQNQQRQNNQQQANRHQTTVGQQPEQQSEHPMSNQSNQSVISTANQPQQPKAATSRIYRRQIKEVDAERRKIAPRKHPRYDPSKMKWVAEHLRQSNSSAPKKDNKEVEKKPDKNCEENKENNMGDEETIKEETAENVDDSSTKSYLPERLQPTCENSSSKNPKRWSVMKKSSTTQLSTDVPKVVVSAPYVQRYDWKIELALLSQDVDSTPFSFAEFKDHVNKEDEPVTSLKTDDNESKDLVSQNVKNLNNLLQEDCRVEERDIPIDLQKEITQEIIGIGKEAQCHSVNSAEPGEIGKKASANVQRTLPRETTKDSEECEEISNEAINLIAPTVTSHEFIPTREDNLEEKIVVKNCSLQSDDSAVSGESYHSALSTQPTVLQEAPSGECVSSAIERQHLKEREEKKEESSINTRRAIDNEINNLSTTLPRDPYYESQQREATLFQALFGMATYDALSDDYQPTPRRRRHALDGIVDDDNDIRNSRLAMLMNGRFIAAPKPSKQFENLFCSDSPM